MYRFILTVWLCTLSTVTFAQLSFSVNDDSRIVLHGEESQILGVEFYSPDGQLIPTVDDEIAPFSFKLASEPTEAVFGTLDAFDLAQDEELVLPLALRADAINDVRITYGTQTQTLVLEPSLNDPPQWSEPVLKQWIIDGVSFERGYSSPWRELEPDQFLVFLELPYSFGSKPDEIPPEYEDDPFIRRIDIASWFPIEFTIDEDAASLEFRGAHFEFGSDGSFMLPPGWHGAMSSGKSRMLISPREIDLASIPEPSTEQMMLMTLALPIALARPVHRRK